nr:hypothetical protein OHB51_17450 [Micromonospora sp. NBC_00855]
MNRDHSEWTRVAFGDVVRNITGSVSDPVERGLERAVGLEHLDSGVLNVGRWGSVGDGATFTRQFQAGQLLFGKRRVYQRKAAVPDFDGVCSGDILVLEAAAEHLLPELLPLIVHADAFLQHAVRTSAGSLSPRTKWSDLARFKFRLPPMAEQRRIADLLWAAEESTARNAEAYEQAREAEISLLAEAYHDPSWPVRKVSEAGDVQLGLKREPKVHTGANLRPYLRVANVGDDEFMLNDVLTMNFKESDFAKYRLLSGDILLNEGQSLELVGRSALYRGEIPDCCFQMTLLRFRCGPDVVPEFAHGWFRRCFHLGQFARVAARTTSMAHMTASIFSVLPIPVPTLDVQREVVARVMAARELRRRLAAHLEATRQLRPQLLNFLLSEF